MCIKNVIPSGDFFVDVHQAIRRKEAERIKQLDNRREQLALNYDPFGKPGAGAPNRDDKG